MESQKNLICEIGRRIYQKGFVAANEGNLSIRLEDDRVLCTPTLHCKGFMEPGDLCIVDMDGNQLEGSKKRTSEVLLHLEIYRLRPDVNAVVHCHPPHATAFGVAREPIPTCVLPEPDIFLGEVPIAPYETPGSKDFASTITRFAKDTNTIVLANHGTVSYESDLEKAYWMTEILEAYCKILLIAKQLGGINHLPGDKGRELLELRLAWGFEDSRIDDEQGGRGSHTKFQSSWDLANLEHRAFPPHPDARRSSASTEAKFDQSELIERIAERVVEKLNERS